MAIPESTQFLTQSSRESFKGRMFSECWAAMTASLQLRDLPPCTYCGVIAGSIDHVPARAVRPQILATGLWRRYPFLEVPCCIECNTALNTRGFTVGERRVLIRKWLRRRYASVLKVPHWSDSELAELRPAFRNYVIRGIVLRQWVSERLEYCKRSQVE